MAEVKAEVVVPEAKVGAAYIVLPPELTVYDVADIRKDPTVNLYRIPFGPARGQLTIRKLILMDWKGKKGKDFIEVAKVHGALLPANELARQISKAYKGVKGVVRIRGTFYPRKGIAQKNWRAEKPELVRIYDEKVKPKIKPAPPALAYVEISPVIT